MEFEVSFMFASKKNNQTLNTTQRMKGSHLLEWIRKTEQNLEIPRELHSYTFSAKGRILAKCVTKKVNLSFGFRFTLMNFADVFIQKVNFVFPGNQTQNCGLGSTMPYWATGKTILKWELNYSVTLNGSNFFPPNVNISCYCYSHVTCTVWK